MDFNLLPAQEELQRRARKFAQMVIAPEALQYDAQNLFPHGTIRKMGQEGFFGVIVPAAFQGSGGGTVEYCIVSEEVARASASYVHNNQFQTQKALLTSGTEEQKNKYLPKLATAESIAAVAISERGMGSSFKGMETRAERKGDFFIVNGHKSHINDAAEADVLTLLAKTGKGLTVFLMDKDTEGFSIVKKLDCSGLRACPMYEFTLKDCPIPHSQVLGQEGKGLEVFFSIFNFSRIGNASAFIGISRGALGFAVEYAKGRKIGNQTVTDFQGLRWLIAELQTKIEAASLFRDKAAWLEEEGRQAAREAPMAKLFAGEVAREVTNRAIEITGAYGCYRDVPLEMHLRDAKALLIGGGTSEVMKNIIAHQILG